METFLLLHLMFLWAQNEFFLCADAIPTLSTESAPFIKDGEYLNITCEVVQHAAAVTWRRNSFSVLIITNTTACSYIKLTSPDTYNYNVTCDQQKRFSMLKYGFNRSDDNTDWSCQVDALDTTDLGISLGVKVYIYKFSPSILYIVGNDSGILSDGDYVPLSVSTGCINPSDSAYYNVTWKYVEATKTVENNFDEKIIRQNVSSSGGCTNTYERNLTFNLIVTNAMNTGNTSLNISQVKMTFTMAGETSIATKNVSYTLIPKVTTTTSSTTTTTTGTTTTTTITTTTTTITTTTTTITPTTTTGTSTSLNSTSMPSSTSNVSIDNTTMKPTTTGPGASTTNTSSMLISSTTDNSNNTALSTTPSNTNNGAKSKVSDSDIKVIVPAVVVPCGLLIIGAIIFLVVWCVRRRAGKNVPKSQDGIGIKYRDKNKDRWKPSTGHGKVTNNHGEYITPDGFIIYPGPAARSTARSYKDKKSHGVTDQYSRPDSWTYHHQADYTPNTYTSAYTHKGKHRVTDQYSEPYTAAYSYQTAYLPSTHKSARTYEQKAKNYDNERHQQASHPMASSRLAYGQTAYYPQTGFYGQSSNDAYYRGDGQYSYGQMSRSHRDYNGHKQQRDYYSQYEMTDYRHDKIGDMHTKQDTSFYY